MGRLVFITTELYPYTAGDIGRILFNVLRSMEDADRARSTVIVLDHKIETESFASALPGVELVQLDSHVPIGQAFDDRRHPPDWAYTNTPWHWRSTVVFRELRRLAATTQIDYVEFQDRGALGFSTIQERLFSGFLSDAKLAVRIHSPHAALLNAEARSVSVVDLNQVDLERKCLRDCDLLVAPLSGVSNMIRDVFDFSPQEWDARVVYHAPPVLMDRHATVSRAVSAQMQGQILFISKLQGIKRPDLFVRGVSAFMRQYPGFVGQAVFSAHSVDEDYDIQVRKLIPVDLSLRFEFIFDEAVVERETLITASTVVISSNYESFCPAAYEASLLGARLVLNDENPGFDDTSPWRDGVNCIKFNGTSTGLAEALARNFHGRLDLVPVVLQRDPWPWLAMLEPRAWVQDVEQPLVSVIVPHYNLAHHLPETLKNVVAFDYPNLEIVLVDDASTDAASQQLIERLEKAETANLKIVRLLGNVGLAAVRNVGVRHATGNYVVTLDCDDLLDKCFVGRAVRALENQPDFDVVVTPAAYFLDGAPTPLQGSAHIADYAVFSGEARLAGLLENRYSTATALFRTSVLQAFPYIEELHCYEDWSLYMRLVEANRRFIVSTEAFFFYRKRPDSMVHTPRSSLARRTEYADLLRTSAPLHWRRGMHHLGIGIGSAAAPTLLSDSSPGLGGAENSNAPDLYQRILHIEQLVERIFVATTPFIKLFQLPTFFWRKLLPLRQRILRARSKIR